MLGFRVGFRVQQARATEESDTISHALLYAAFVGGFQLIKISEQEMEGAHAQMGKIIEGRPNHTAALLSNELRLIWTTWNWHRYVIAFICKRGWSVIRTHIYAHEHQ